MIDKIKHKQRSDKQKCTEMRYHVQEDADVSHKDVNTFLNKNQVISLPFFGPHTKPYGVRWFCKHYHMRFDPKLGYIIW